MRACVYIYCTVCVYVCMCMYVCVYRYSILLCMSVICAYLLLFLFIQFVYSQVPVLEGFGTFVTRTDVAKAVSLPSYIREHFRSFTLSFPPTGILFRVNAAILGYKQPRLLADRLVMMHTLIHEQM